MPMKDGIHQRPAFEQNVQEIQVYYDKKAQLIKEDASFRKKMVDEYKQFSAQKNEQNVFSALTARRLVPEYRNAEEEGRKDICQAISPAIFNFAVTLQQIALRMRIAEHPREGESNAVVFLIGPPCAGKSSSRSLVMKDLGKKWPPHAFYDDPIALQDLQEHLQVAHKHNREAFIYYTHRDIPNASYGVIKRSVDEGRIIPMNIFARMHYEMPKTTLCVSLT